MMPSSEVHRLREIACMYEAEAKKHPKDSLGRIANIAEAVKYHDLAEKAKKWPEARDADAE